MMGYSRELEREADAIGFERMAQAGYAVREAKMPFERLAREAAVMDYDQPVFFASHPAMAERVESFRRMEAAEPPGGSTNRDAYQARAQRAVGDALAADLGAHNAAVVIFLLETEGLLAAYPPEYRYYLAEAYRIRGGEGDETRAEAEYLATLTACPAHAPSHGALGLVRMKQGRYAEACALFDRYLALDPQAPDKAYIESYLGRLREEQP
jgi:predicted Zn-dependent protease